MRLASWVVALLVVAATSNARAADVDYATFKTAFQQMVGAGIDAQADVLKAKLDAGGLPDWEIERIQAEQKELKLLKKRVDDTNMAEALWDSVKNSKDAIKKIAADADRAYNAAAHLGVITAQEVSLVAKGSELAGKGVDYLVKMKELSGDLDKISTAALSPGTKQLSSSMTVLFSLASTFGKHAPLVGTFIATYGDIGAELLKSTLALDEKIAAAEQGQIIPGVHGDRGAMLDKLTARGLADAQRVDGLRDVFQASNGEFLIWDGKARDWVAASQWEAGITEAELKRRYVFYAKLGNKEPTPEQILKGYRRTIALELIPSAGVVAPGETVTFTVRGRMVKDNAPLEGRSFYVAVTLDSHTGVGEGAFVGSTTVKKIGETVTWTTPDNLDETYTFAVDLAGETKVAASSAGPAQAKVRTGAVTTLTIEANEEEVPAGTEVELTARVLANGKPLSGKVGGAFEWTVTPPLGVLANQQALTDQKGEKRTWLAPEKTGTYVIRARFDGAASHALFGSHTAGSWAEITITVVDPVLDGGPGDGGGPADAGEDPPDAAPDDQPGPDAGPGVDRWTGRWRGKARTEMTMGGVSSTHDEQVELTVTEIGDTVRLVRAGQPPSDLKITPSNPLAASGGGPIPRPVNSPLITRFSGHSKVAAFVRDGKLHLAIHVEVSATAKVSEDAPEVTENTVMDTIAVFDRVPP